MERGRATVENPHPDFTDVVADADFKGVAWAPTVLLRWVEREETEYIDPHHGRVEVRQYLQQLWETTVVNNTGKLVKIFNPGKREWRDVPIKDESEDL